ncbi:hypothetical protein D3C86_1153300 [compost metagenome]
MVEHVVEQVEVADQLLHAAAQLHQAVDGSEEAEDHGLDGHQHAEAQMPIGHPEAPDHQDRGGGQGREQARQDRERLLLDLHLLGGLQEPRLIPRPASEEVSLRGGGLQGLDRAQARQRETRQPTVRLSEAHVGLHPTLADPVQDHEVDGAGKHGDARQDGVVEEHETAVEQDHEQIDRGPGEVPGENPRDSVVDLDPVGDLTGVALGVETERKRQQVLHEPAGLGDRKLALQAAQVRDAQVREDELEHDHQGGREDQGYQPSRLVLDEHVIDEDLRGHWQRQARHHQQQGGEHQVEDVSA